MSSGLDNAGKSTLVAQWTDGDVRSVAPTIGFQIRTLQYEMPSLNPITGIAGGLSYQLHLWDIGGQRTIRAYWRNYFEETDGLIFVIDAAAPHRFHEALQELSGVLAQDRLANASLLILLNKQDCPGAVSVLQFEELFQLKKVLGERNGKTHWNVLGCTAIDVGKQAQLHLASTLDWLVGDIAQRVYCHYRCPQQQQQTSGDIVL
jgi:ADP-ribosylation factor-like protein 2